MELARRTARLPGSQDDLQEGSSARIFDGHSSKRETNPDKFSSPWVYRTLVTVNDRDLEGVSGPWVCSGWHIVDRYSVAEENDE